MVEIQKHKLVPIPYPGSYNSPDDNCSGLGYVMRAHRAPDGTKCQPFDIVLQEHDLSPDPLDPLYSLYICACGLEHRVIPKNGPHDLENKLTDPGIPRPESS